MLALTRTLTPIVCHSRLPLLPQNTRLTWVSRQVTVSTILYWSMIEAGLAIVAACLPTLQYLVRKSSLDSMFSSVRSAFSLHSFPSQRSSLGTKAPYENMGGGSDSASNAPIVEANKTSNVFVMENVKSSRNGDDGIYITTKLEQHDSMV